MAKPLEIILGLALVVAGIVFGVRGLNVILSPDQYQATAKIKVEDYISDPVLNRLIYTNYSVSFDPYFIQTTFEIIWSQIVLSIVVSALDLNGKWSKRHKGGLRLNTAESMAIIRKHLHLSPIRGTQLITITYISADPKEAADVANAVAESYLAYRRDYRQRMIRQAVETWQQQLQIAGSNILLLQTNMEQLRQRFQVTNEMQAKFPEQRPYLDAKQELKVAQIHRDLFKSKLAEVDLDSKMISHAMSLITDPAEPSKAPIGPNRFLGAGLLVLGFGLLAGGICLLKSAKS